MRREIRKLMFKFRLTAAVLFGALVLSAIGVSSALASWLIEGKELASTAALATTALVDENSTLLVPTLGLSVVCGGHTFDGLAPEITSENAIRAKALTFLGCNTTIPSSGCALKESNQAIPTVAIKAAALEATTYPEDRLVVTPQTKTTLANIEFNEANTCAFSGLEPVKGSVRLGAPTLQEEQVVQPIVGLGSTENNSLEIAGDKAFLDGGRVLVKLATGEKFRQIPAFTYRYPTEVIHFNNNTVNEASMTITNDGSDQIETENEKTNLEGTFKAAKNCQGMPLNFNRACVMKAKLEIVENRMAVFSATVKDNVTGRTAAINIVLQNP
jgi:hypothetical protein